MGLESSKITERKRNIDLLNELLSDNDVIRNLNCEDNRFRWINLLNAIENYLMQEAKKLSEEESKKRSGDFRLKTRKVGTILIEVVSKANCDEARLPGGKLVSLALQGLEMSILRKCFAEQYVDLLVVHVLPVKKYWYEVESNRWLDVFSMLKEIYQNNNLNIRITAVIEGLFLIVKHSDLHCSLLYSIRREFEFVTKVCENVDVNMEKSRQEFVLKLARAFCLKLAKDCRLACCKFGEKIFNRTFGLYQSRYEDHGELKSLIFEFMLLQMNLHHPNGAFEGSNSAYAYDWDEWRTQLKLLHSMITQEMDLKIRCKSDAARQKLQTNFLQLTVEVFRQIFHPNNESTNSVQLSTDDEIGPDPKRRKLETSISSIVQTIQQQSAWPWMIVFKELLNVYPDTIAPGDYTSLLQVLGNLQIECKDPNTSLHLFNLLAAMAQNQQAIADEFMDSNFVEVQWSKIWETTRQVVGVNQNNEAIHNLLQSLLLFKKTSQPSSLFDAYITGKIKLFSFSL